MRSRLVGWWGNKPRAVRFMIRAGTLASVALLVASLGVDAGRLGLKATFPGLPGFLWDLTKGVLLGTIAVGVVDDLRRAAGWDRVVKGNVAGLSNASSTLLSATWEYFGGSHEFTSGIGRLPDAEAERLASWFATVHHRQYAALYRQQHSAPAPQPIRSWDELRHTLLEAGQAAPDRQLLQAEGEVTRAEQAVVAFCEQLEHLDDDTATRASLASIDAVRAALPGIVTSLTAYRSWLAGLPETAPDAPWGVNGSSVVAVGTSQRHAVGQSCSVALDLSSAFSTVGRLLRVLNFEMETGRPHPYRG
jgi:hypothetical protein